MIRSLRPFRPCVMIGGSSIIDIQNRHIVGQCKYAYGGQRWCAQDKVTRARNALVKVSAETREIS